MATESPRLPLHEEKKQHYSHELSRVAKRKGKRKKERRGKPSVRCVGECGLDGGGPAAIPPFPGIRNASAARSEARLPACLPDPHRVHRHSYSATQVLFLLPLSTPQRSAHLLPPSLPPLARHVSISLTSPPPKLPPGMLLYRYPSSPLLGRSHLPPNPRSL
jgi:hypothetical protein